MQSDPSGHEEMSRTISLFLIFALGFQCLSKLGLIAYYNINIEYIIQELCENKDKPQLNCKGKCYLKKKLNEADKAENQTSRTLKQLELPVFICNHHNFKTIQNQEPVKLTKFQEDLYAYLSIDYIFHPPPFIAYS